MAFGRSKSARDAVVERLHQYLRAGIEYLEPTDHPEASSIEIADIVAALDRQVENEPVSEQPVPEAADEPVINEPASEPEQEEEVVASQEENTQLERLRALEKQIQDAEKAIRERDQSIEVLQVKLLNREETRYEEAPEKAEPEEAKSPKSTKKTKQKSAKKAPETLTPDARAAAILAELEDSRKDIESRLKNPENLSKTHIAQLKQDLAMIRRTRDEITQRLRLQQQRDAS